ncbi:5'-3' exonuclease [candidate division SR1 bacterium]|nr:5'-3' exonuclease [candidate division SR1 bacterium]
MKNFFLIDGFAFLYRAYYAFPEMRDMDEQNINAVYGFLRMIMKRIAQKPDYFMIAWDGPIKTFRHEIFSEYKATRKKMENDFKDQIPLIQSIVSELGIPTLMIPGFEADDILASVIWRFYVDENLHFSLFTGDKDLKQLLKPRITIVDPNKDQEYKKADFLREFGFEPEFILDYLALLGDSADNVKGVAGIGEKKALNLIQQYNSIENIYEHIDEIQPSISGILTVGKEDAFASKKLIQLAEIDLSSENLEKFRFSLDYSQWIDILGRKYHFSSLEKLLLNMRKEAEKPQQLGLF